MPLEYWNTDFSQASGRGNMVLVPSSLPIVSRLSIDSIMSSLDDYVFDKTENSHIRHIIEALCGECGMGELLRQSVNAWLNGGVETAWLTFVDRLFAQIYGLPRIYEETNNFEPTDAIVTTDEMSQILIKEAWYKARFVDLMRAMNCGGTVKGFKYAVHALTYDDCDLYETWRYNKMDFPVGRMNYTLYNEVVIAPYNKDYTPKQGELLLRVLDRIKPADCIVTLNNQGLEQSIAYDIRDISASSTYFEIVKHFTNTIDTSKLPPSEDIYGQVMPYGYDEMPNLDIGETVEVRNAVQNHTQEYYEYYVYDKSSTSQIQQVTYGTSTEDSLDVVPEDTWVEQTRTVKWSTWRHFEYADSPDNYPGGKYGQTPKQAPALAKDGSPYIFDWNSQEEYERTFGQQIIDEGGQVSGHTYRTILNVSTSSDTFLPEFSVISVNDAMDVVQLLPSKADPQTNVQTDSFHKGIQ